MASVATVYQKLKDDEAFQLASELKDFVSMQMVLRAHKYNYTLEHAVVIIRYAEESAPVLRY